MTHGKMGYLNLKNPPINERLYRLYLKITGLNKKNKKVYKYNSKHYTQIIIYLHYMQFHQLTKT